MVSYHLYNYLKDLKGIYECIPLVPQNLDAYPSFCLSHFGGRMWRTNQSLSCTAEEWLLWWLCPAHTLHTRVLTWFNVNKRKHRFSQRFSELRRFTSEHCCFFIKPSELLTSRRITWSWKIQVYIFKYIYIYKCFGLSPLPVIVANEGLRGCPTKISY